jgi:hypothetical protein
MNKQSSCGGTQTMRIALLKTFAFIALGGWLAAVPVGLSHGQNTSASGGAASGGAAGGVGAQMGSTTAGTGGTAGAQAAAAARGQFGTPAAGANARISASANQRTQAAINAARQTQMRAGNQARSVGGSANLQNGQRATAAQRQFDARARTNAAGTGRTQASSVDTDRMNNPFDSRSNDRFDDGFDNRNRSGAFDDRGQDSGLFDDRTDIRPRRTGDTRRAQRPTMPLQGLDRAGQQLDVNRQRFEDRTGAVNRGLDTARDRVERNIDRFDARTGTAIDDRFDVRDRVDQFPDRADVRGSTDAMDRQGLTQTDRARRLEMMRDRRARIDERNFDDEFERGARFDARIDDDELRFGLSDDPRLRGDRDPRIRVDERRTVDPLDRSRLRLDVDGGNIRGSTDALDRQGLTQPDRARRLEMTRERRARIDDRNLADPRFDPRLDAPRRTFAEEIDVRAQNRFRDDLGVRRNLSSGPRQTGFRGIEATTDRMNLNSDRFDGGTSQSPRTSSERLESTPRGPSDDRLNRRAVGERIE